MLRAKTATDLLAATSRLQTVIGAAPLGNGDDESDVPHPSPSSQSGVANCEPQDPPRCGDLKWPLQLLPHRATSASLAAAIIESGGPVVEDLTPSALGIQVADLLTPNSTSAELALNGGLTSSPSSAGISGHRQPSGQPSKRLKAGCAGGVSGAASANPVLHTSMAPPPAPPAVARHSVLRSKRPAGATDLNLIRPENSAFENSLQSTGFPSGSLPSNTSLAGYLDSPAMLNQFAAQMSPKVGEQFGLTPNAMLDFLTTDDMLAQISSCASAEEERIESGSPAVGASPD